MRPNGFFAGGHGDFSVVLDRDREYFYFLFTNYGGAAATHGVSVARMPFNRRGDPIGAVLKYFEGEWKEAGAGGRVTPVLPATTGWDQSKTDSFWGPAVHWNTFLQNYVVLLNRACCDPGWPQEGIYIFFAANLAEPSEWTEPQKLLDAADVDFSPAYYPQAVGTQPGGTDTARRRVSAAFRKRDFVLVSGVQSRRHLGQRRGRVPRRESTAAKEQPGRSGGRRSQVRSGNRQFRASGRLSHRVTAVLLTLQDHWQR